MPALLRLEHNLRLVTLTCDNHSSLPNHDTKAAKMGDKDEDKIIDVEAELLAAGKEFDKVSSPSSYLNVYLY